MKKVSLFFISFLLIFVSFSCKFNVSDNFNTGSVSVTLPGASSSRFTLNEENPELPAEYTIKITSTTGSYKYEKTYPEASVVKIEEIPAGKYEVSVKGIGLSFYYENSTEITVYSGKESQAVLDLEKFLKLIYVTDKEITPEENSRSFNTVTDAIKFLESNNYNEGKIFIDGSINDSIMIEPVSKIQTLSIEKAPEATKAELVAVSETQPDGTLYKKPVLMLLQDNTQVNISLKDITLKSDSKSDTLVMINKGTCSLTNIKFDIPEPVIRLPEPGDFATSLVSLAPATNLKIGGNFIIPKYTGITMSANGESIITDPATITITAPLKIENIINIGTDYPLDSGIQLIKGENNINVKEEIKNFGLQQYPQQQDSRYGFDENGRIKKTHIAIYLQADDEITNCSCLINGKTFDIGRFPANQPEPIIVAERNAYMAEIGKPLTVEVTLKKGSPDDSGIKQTHIITPKDTDEPNIIALNTIFDYYIDNTSAANDSNNGLSYSSPLKTLPKAMEKIRNKTKYSNTKVPKEDYKIHLKAGKSTLQMTTPIILDTPIKVTIINEGDLSTVEIPTLKNDNTEIIVINNPEAEFLVDHLIFNSNNTNLTNSGLVKVTSGFFAMTNCEFNTGLDHNGIYLGNGATLKLTGIEDFDSLIYFKPVNNPIYLNKDSNIILNFDTSEDNFKLHISSDYDKTKTIIKPMPPATELTSNQISSLKIKSEDGKIYDIDSTGKLVQTAIINYGLDYIPNEIYKQPTQSCFWKITNLTDNKQPIKFETPIETDTKSSTINYKNNTPYRFEIGKKYKIELITPDDADKPQNCTDITVQSSAENQLRFILKHDYYVNTTSNTNDGLSPFSRLGDAVTKIQSFLYSNPHSFKIYVTGNTEELSCINFYSPHTFEIIGNDQSPSEIKLINFAPAQPDQKESLLYIGMQIQNQQNKQSITLKNLKLNSGGIATNSIVHIKKGTLNIENNAYITGNDSNDKIPGIVVENGSNLAKDGSSNVITFKNNGKINATNIIKLPRTATIKINGNLTSDKSATIESLDHAQGDSVLTGTLNKSNLEKFEVQQKVTDTTIYDYSIDPTTGKINISENPVIHMGG